MAGSGEEIITLFLFFVIVMALIKPQAYKEGFQNINSLATVCVESFGNFKKGSMSEAPVNNADTSISTNKAEFEIFQSAVNASIPSHGQLDLIANNKNSGDSMQAFNTKSVGGLDNFAAIDFGGEIDAMTSPCAPSAPTWDSAALLPKGTGNSMKSFQFSEDQEDLLASQSWLTAAERIGINTTLGSLRNSSQDLRGDPHIIGMKKISPFRNPTIYPDFTRRPLYTAQTIDPSYNVATKKARAMFN